MVRFVHTYISTGHIHSLCIALLLPFEASLLIVLDPAVAILDITCICIFANFHLQRQLPVEGNASLKAGKPNYLCT